MDSQSAKKARGIKSLEKALGVSDTSDLLLLMPVGCSDFSASHPPLRDGDDFCGRARVISAPQKHAFKAMWTFEIEALSSPGIPIGVSVFGPHLSRTKDWADVHLGASFYIKGLLKQFGHKYFLNKAQRVPDEHFGRVIPQYRGIPRVLAPDQLREMIWEALAVPELLDTAIVRLEQSLGSASPGADRLRDLLRDLHMPKSLQAHETAQQLARRLSVQAILAHVTEKPSVVQPESSVRLDWFALQGIKAALPFVLSPSQEAAVEGIVQLLEDPLPMNALLSGDVGSGKTITYALVAVAAWKAGARVAILAPNTPLAHQIAAEINTYFPAVPVVKVTAKSGKNPLAPGILVGTTALLSYARRHQWKADVLVLDEQQKFGLDQKRALAHDATNVLEATATCIPQTLGLIQHGGMQIFRLQGHAQKDLETRVVGLQDRPLLAASLKKTIANGDRAVIIYPQVRTDSDNFRRNVIAAAEKWEALMPGKVALLHGKQSEADKAAVLDLVRSGAKPVLVATSIIEVGITIPKLRLGIVVSADRYGLSTLHQMRGRLAREGGKGLFFLYLPFQIQTPTKEQALIVERLKIMESTTDGFALAEADAARRGFGDLVGEDGTQHGKTLTPFLGLSLRPEDFQSA